jgi:hypothetical protein
MGTQSTPEGPGSVSGAPNLPEGLTDAFTMPRRPRPRRMLPRLAR